jgi:DNA polymerase-3 subunit epsilon
MRQVVLDTETTGLEPELGHRIIEIGCVELLNRRLTGQRFHQYLQPDREIDPGAVEVHGLTNAFLADKPRFADVAEDFLAFVRGAELIIHNAPFDVGFINHELTRFSAGLGTLTEHCQVLDTLALARQLHPGQKNNLDALCRRYGVDNSQRDLHGALLDAEILAELYLAMTGGQAALALDAASAGPAYQQLAAQPVSAERPPLRIVRASPAELEAHAARLAGIDKASAGNCLWRLLEPGGADGGQG